MSGALGVLEDDTDPLNSPRKRQTEGGAAAGTSVKFRAGAVSCELDGEASPAAAKSSDACSLPRTRPMIEENMDERQRVIG